MENNDRTNNNRKAIPFTHVKQMETGIAGQTFREAQKARDLKVYTFLKNGELEKDYINAVKSNSPILARYYPFCLAENLPCPSSIQSALKVFALVEYGFLCFSHKSRTLSPSMMDPKHIEDRLQSIKACWKQKTLNAGSVFETKQDLIDFFLCETYYLNLWGFIPKSHNKYWTRSNKFYLSNGELASLTAEEFISLQQLALSAK